MLRQEKDYELNVGESQTDEVGTGQVYQIINRKTGIVEAESRILPQAYDYLEQLQKALDEHKSQAQEESVKSGQAVIKPYRH